jgi:hypothetical protein
MLEPASIRSDSPFLAGEVEKAVLVLGVEGTAGSG